MARLSPNFNATVARLLSGPRAELARFKFKAAEAALSAARSSEMPPSVVEGKRQQHSHMLHYAYATVHAAPPFREG